MTSRYCCAFLWSGSVNGFRLGTARGAAVLALTILLAPATVRAQDPEFWGGISATAARERVRFSAAEEELRGLVMGVEGGIDWTLARLRLGYAEGTLRPRSVGGISHTVVESWALIGTRVVGGLEVSGGLQARAYVTAPGTERWLLWQLRARYEHSMIDGAVQAYTELWRSPAGTVNAVNILRSTPETGETGFRARLEGKPVNKSFRGASGGEAGLILHGAGWRPSVRVGYSIDAARLDAGGYRDSVEGFTIAISFDTRRNFND